MYQSTKAFITLSVYSAVLWAIVAAPNNNYHVFQRSTAAAASALQIHRHSSSIDLMWIADDRMNE